VGLNPEFNQKNRGQPARSAGLLWTTRIFLAAGGPLLCFLALEGGLRIAGSGRPSDLFIPDSKPGFYRTNPDFTRAYFPARFDITPLNFRLTKRKEAGHIRVFVLGESAVRGTPEPGFGFVSLLRAQLKAAYPGKEFEVYNLGIVAINSHAVYRMAREAAEFEPDLLIVYMGNNEVVGPYGPGSTSAPLFVIRAAIWAKGTRTGQLLASLLARHAASGVHSSDWRGMTTFANDAVRGNDPNLAGVYRNYEENLKDLARFASGRGIPTIVATVVANLKDCPPFDSRHRVGMTGAQLESWQSAYDQGRKLWEAGLTTAATGPLNAALRLDPEFANTHYILGKLLEAGGDVAAARAQFLEALHWDALRFRPDTPINAAARRVAAGFPGSVFLTDCALELGADPASPVPPAGREILLEHVHFNWEGNEQMGRLLAKKAASVLFGAGTAPGAWLDSSGCADAVGFTAYGRLRILRLMGAILGNAPFTNQITFGEDQVRYQRAVQLATGQATSVEGFARARLEIEAASARDPQNPAPPLQLAGLESESGQPAEALRAIDRVLELEPKSPELLVLRGRALLALQREGEALAAVTEALRIDPNDLPAYTALVEVLQKGGEFATGRRILKAALARNPDSSYLRLTYSDLLFFHGDRDEAVGDCKLVLAADPENADALRRLVSLYTAAGNQEEAIALMKAARHTQPLNYENNIALARIYNDRGDDADVADCLEAATLSGPADAPIHLYLSSHFKKLHRPLDALVELARAQRVASEMGNTELAKRISESIRAGAGTP
jgi:tetratricopeptide (TPR) repeat protein